MPKLYKDRITVSLGMPELDVLGMEETEAEVMIQVKRVRDFEVCEGCGKITDRIHNHWWTRVRDLPMFGKKTFLVVMKRRFRCPNGCQPFTEHIAGFEKYKRQTKRYRDHLEISCRHSSIASASSKEEVGYKLLDRLYFERAGSKARSVDQQALPEVMGVDEFSGKKHFKMHMGITDLSGKPELWDVIKTKGCVEFIDFFKRYSKEAREKVRAIVHDMDLGINSWARAMFQGAIHVIDKFHLVRCFLKHLENVRKAVYYKSQNKVNQKKIRSSYWLIKKRRKTMSEEQQQRLEEVLVLSKTLKEAYEVKEDFMAWYDRPKRRSEAEMELLQLHKRIREIPHLRRVTWALDKWWDEILNYFVLTYSNGFTEGMNNKIKTLKRQAYGFRNFERFRVRILNECAFN